MLPAFHEPLVHLFQCIALEDGWVTIDFKIEGGEFGDDISVCQAGEETFIIRCGMAGGIQ